MRHLTTETEAVLERDAELARIDAALADARAGRGRLLLVEGAAGSGKSTLLAAARERAAADGFEALAARAGEFERDYAFGCVRQLFEPLLEGTPASERARLLTGAAAPAAWVVAPAAAAHDRAAAGFAAVNAIYWLAANVAAQRPLLLVADDLHWADDASLHALAHLGRRVGDLPLALVVALRPEEPGAAAVLLDDLRAAAGAGIVAPRPLSAAAVARLVRAQAPEASEQACAACHAASAGNPLYLRELLRALDGDPALGLGGDAAAVAASSLPTLAARVGRRIAKVGAGAPALAQAMAVVGDGGELSLAAALAGVERPSAARIARRLRELEVLADDDPVAFVHPLVRRSIYDGLARAERDAAHARAAELLRGAGAPVEAIAALRPAGSEAVAAGLLTAAGEAAARAAPDAAVRLLRRALEEEAEQPPRAELLLRLGLVELTVRDPQCVTSLTQARELAASPAQRVAATAALGELLTAAGQWETAQTLIWEGLRECDPEHAVDLEALRCGVAVHDPRHVGEFERDRAHFERLAEGPSWSAHALMALLAAQVAVRGEGPERARALAERALRGGVLLRERPAGAWVGAQVLLALAYGGHTARALEVAAEVEQEGRRSGSLIGLVGGSGCRGLVACLRGDLLSAEAELRVVLELLDQSDMAMWFSSLFFMFADAIVERPSLADAAARVETLALTPDFLDTAGGALLRNARARLQLARGDRAGALDDLEAAGATMAALRIGPAYVPWRTELALALPAAERSRALGLAEEELALARATGLPRPLGVALRGAGLLQGGAEGLRSLRASVAALEQSEAQLELARSLVALGAALRRSRRRVQAREPLAAGMELAHACGAERLVAQAREELLAAGGRPRRIARSGVDALTASELRVVRLAAGGATNVAIAQELYVSVKTVETHLSHAYGKLGLAGQGARGRLAAALAENSGADPDAPPAAAREDGAR